MEFTSSIKCFSFKKIKVGYNLLFSSRKFVQYVHNNGCGCHKVASLPFDTVNVSRMQMEGVELCTKLGALTAVFGRVAFYPASSKVQSVFI